MTAADVTEWMAYEYVEGFGGHAEDRRTARLAAVLASLKGLKRQDGEPFGESDFMPSASREPEPEPTHEELRQKIEARLR